MITNIHTHTSQPNGIISVQNLTLQESELFLNSNKSNLFSTGFQPWFLEEFSTESFRQLEELATHPQMIFIGECGLDKNSRFDIDFQTIVFKKQIELSEKTQKPLIIHCVGCFNELVSLKNELIPTQRWIIHGFRGKPQLASQLIKAGFSLSFGEHFNVESVRQTPINKLFIETDESQIPVTEMYAKIAQIKSCKVEELNAGSLLIDSIKSKY